MSVPKKLIQKFPKIKHNNSDKSNAKITDNQFENFLKIELKSFLKSDSTAV